MKKTIIITGIVVAAAILALFIFNKITAKKDTASLFAEVSEGRFEIAITSTGELVAERSVDISAPALTMQRDIRSMNVKIQDLIAEGTEVKEGDWVATLDRTEFANTLKDEQERVATLYTDLEMALLDTALTLSNLRDQIENQIHTVEEARITLRNSKYEPPTTIRQAEINYDKAQRVLEQMRRSYTLGIAQSKIKVQNINTRINRFGRRVRDYEEVLAGFVIKAPSSGMIIYKKDRMGSKRKAGGSVNPMDRVVATLPDLSSMLSKVYVSEIEINKVKTGLPVSITVDAFPDKSYTGSVMTIANIGEKLPNSDSKVFEVMIKIDGSDYSLRPSMTTNNKITVKTLDNVTYIPNECVRTGIDSIPVVYTRNRLKQVVIPGESNDKETVIEKGLKAGTVLYLEIPEDAGKFRLAGEELIQVIRNRESTMNEIIKMEIKGLN
ncbi:MAG: efflux RND transporter periplasmic adaptor subunit [Bacteroidia bacterium]|nr:efflux RND transporter periplasmic adaptor subunit [Bacteroidia bacterium]